MTAPAATSARPDDAPDETVRPRRRVPGDRRWWTIGILAVVVLLPLRGLMRAPGPPMEEGFMLVFPEQVLRGAIPNRDFLHLYGPGSLWVLAAVFKVFSTSLWTERTVGYLQQLALVAGVFAWVRPYGRRLAVGGAALTAIIIIPPIGLTALAWVGGVALAVWAAVAIQRRHFLLAGVLAGFALLYRPDLVLALTLVGIAAWPALDRRDRKAVAGGFALGVSPFLVQVALAGPGHAFYGMVLQPVFQLRGGRHLPLPPSWSHFDGFLQRAGQLNAPSWPFPSPPSPSQLTLWFLLLVAVAVFVAAVGWRARRTAPRDLRARTILVMGALCCGLLPQAFQRPDSTHLAWVSAVPFGVLPVALAYVLRNWTRPARVRLTVAALAPSVALFLIVPHFTFRTYADAVAQSFDRHRESYVIENEGRTFYYGRRDAADAVNAMLPVVDSIARPGDRLFVGTGDLRKTPYSEAFLYYLLPQTDPATRYIEMDPGVANANDSGLADDLASADIAILSSIRDDWVEPNTSRDFGSDAPNQVLRDHFCQVGSWGKGLFGHGLYELYRRCK